MLHLCTCNLIEFPHNRIISVDIMAARKRTLLKVIILGDSGCGGGWG